MQIRTPKNQPAYVQSLLHRETDNAICGTLVVHGWEEQDLQDGLQEVRLRTIRRFAQGTPPPGTLDEMKAFCAKIARDYAVDCLRKKKFRDRYDVGLCEFPDDYSPLSPAFEERDPVDASRQLDIVKQLFAEAVMPDNGWEILLDVASEATYPEIAEDLELTVDTVRGRMRKMRKLFKARLP